MEQKQFLTIEDISKELSVSRQTVAKYISQKELNAIKMNKSYRIHYQDFENFLTKKTTINEAVISYQANTRFCHLEYENKEDMYSIYQNGIHYEINEIKIEHKNYFNEFYLGDNLLALKSLQNKLYGKIDLIYIDPPFGTGQNFNNIEDELAYEDTLVNHNYLEFLRKRLFLLKDLMSEQGSIYVHIDKKIGHYVKIIMDEVFGYKNFINDITRIKCNPKNFARNAYGNYSDMILFYAKKRDANIWNEIKQPLTEEESLTLFPKTHPTKGKYTTNPLHAPGKTINGDTGEEWNGLKPPKGRHWRYSRAELTRLEEEGLIEWSGNGNPRKMVFLEEHNGKKIQDVWEFKDKGLSYIKYPTQKNFDLLKRIIMNSSNENSIVLDAFAGSGSTLQVADSLKRRWIGIDNSPSSFEVIKQNFKEHKIKCNYFAIEKQD
jgi:adenine-specific DNA-methyltransferase